MRTKILILCGLTLIISSCKKNQFSTSPQLTFESLSTEVLAPGNTITITLKYTDKEGDIQDSLFVQKLTQNCEQSNFEAYYKISDQVPTQQNSEGEILVTYGYLTGQAIPEIKGPVCLENDTCVLRFVLSDKMKNKSDTVTTPPFVILK